MKKFWIYIGIGELNRFEKYQGRHHGAMTHEEAKSDAIRYGYKFRDDFDPEEFKNLTKDNVIIYPMDKVPSWLINNITLRRGYGIFD